MLDKKDVNLLKKMCKPLSIMIVDDEINLANEYKDLASYFFDNITVVNDVTTALNKYETATFDIIYTDINMPNINGIEMIKKIKSINKGQHFIVMSASDDSSHLLELLKLKISTFILKPFKVDEFISATSEITAILYQDRIINDRSRNMAIALKEATIEKKKQEDMLIQQSKLAQTGEMVSMIAHQWRQPLSSITTQVATIKTRLDLGVYDNEESPFETLSSDLYKSFEKIEKSSSFLSDTINNFRNFYRPNNTIGDFEIKDTINSVLEILMIEHSGIHIERSYLSSQEIIVESHEGELQQVLMSILNNARDALIEKDIEKPLVKIETNCDGKDLSIVVLDNAGGIDDSIINNIFLPYFSTKTEKNGTGIGLHMAQTIIEKHMMGTIKAQNSLEFNGARFTITIPLKKD